MQSILQASWKSLHLNVISCILFSMQTSENDLWPWPSCVQEFPLQHALAQGSLAVVILVSETFSCKSMCGHTKAGCARVQLIHPCAVATSSLLRGTAREGAWPRRLGVLRMFPGAWPRRCQELPAWTVLGPLFLRPPVASVHPWWPAEGVQVTLVDLLRGNRGGFLVGY